MASKKKATPAPAVKASKLVSELTDHDQFTTPNTMSFAARAGLPTYRRELQERLQDIEEASSTTLFLLPLKLTKTRYKQLVLAALERNLSEWTEQDEIHQLIKASTPLKSDPKAL